MPTPNVNTINTAIREHYLPQVVDNIFKSNALLQILLGKSKKQNGGENLRVPVEFEDEGPSQGFYSGYELLNTEQPEILDTAFYEWVQAYAAINISGLDQMKNTGPDGIIDVLEKRMKNAEKRLKKLFTTKLFAAAAANASNEITSLNDIVNVDRTLGAIDSTTYTWWDAFVYANGASSYTELITFLDPDYLIKDMAHTFNFVSDGADKVDLIITTDEVTEAYDHITSGQKRWTGDSRLVDAGWEVYKYKGAEMVADKRCTAGQMFFLNTDYLYFKHHPQRNFAFQPFRKPVNQDAMTAFIFWMGQFVCSQPRRQGVLTTIPTP